MKRKLTIILFMFTIMLASPVLSSLQEGPINLVMEEKVAEEGWESINFIESRSGDYLYLTSAHDYKLYVVDTDDLSVVSDLSLDGWLTDVVEHPSEDVVFVTSTAGSTRSEQYPVVYIIDVENGVASLEDEIRTQTARSGERMDSATISPDGNNIYLMHRSGIIIKADLSTHSTQRLPNGVSGGSYNNIYINPKGDHLYAQAGATNKMEVYDINNDYEKVTKFRSTSRPIFNSDGSLMVLPYLSSSRIIRTEDYSVVSYLDNMDDFVTNVGFAQNENIFITMTLGYMINIYDTSSYGALLERTTLEGYTSYTSPDEAIVSQCGDRIYYSNSGKVAIYEISEEFRETKEDIRLDRLNRVNELSTDVYSVFDVISDSSNSRVLIFDSHNTEDLDYEGKIKLVDIPSGRTSKISGSNYPDLFEEHGASRFIGPDGENLYIVSTSKIIEFNLENQNINDYEIDLDLNSVGYAEFKDDNTLLITVEEREITDRGTRIDTTFLLCYNMRSQSVDCKIELPFNRAGDLKISPDRTIALVTNPIGESTVIVDLTKNEIKETVRIQRVNTISISKDGKEAYLFSHNLNVLDLEDFTDNLFYIGVGESEDHALPSDDFIITSNEGDNNMVLIETTRYTPFASAHVGAEPEGVFYFEDSNLLATYDEGSSKIIVFDLIEPPNYGSEFLPENLKLYVDVPTQRRISVGRDGGSSVSYVEDYSAPMEAKITVFVKNIGDLGGSLPVKVDGREVESIEVSPFEESYFDFEYTFDNPGEYEIVFGDESKILTVEGDSDTQDTDVDDSPPGESFDEDQEPADSPPYELGFGQEEPHQKTDDFFTVIINFVRGLFS